MTIREMLADRLTKLQALRTQKAAQHAAEIARLDDQIAACRSLALNWDSLTIDQALATLQDTGVRLRLES